MEDSRDIDKSSGEEGRAEYKQCDNYFLNQVKQSRIHTKSCCEKSEWICVNRQAKSDEDNNSKYTKKEIKNRIDVAKLGIGITKL